MCRHLVAARIPAWFISAVLAAGLTGAGATHGLAQGTVSSFSGAFSQAVSIEVPAFRGLGPRLVLGYSSQGGNGFVGVGWSLSGFGVLSRGSPGHGTPRFDSSDVFYLGGQELVPCEPGSVSPSCTTGGSHSTEVESYVRVDFDSGQNEWTVWSKDGTRTVFTSVYDVPSGTLWWGQTSRIDTHDNTVTYNWACQGGDCYPDSVDFGPYSVTIYRETRTDVITSAAGSQYALRTMTDRLRSILVEYQSSPIRAYKLTYTTSPATGASLLAEVQQFGTDVVIDGAGAISGGTALPPRTFTYQGDATVRRFAQWPEEETVEAPWVPPAGFPGDTPSTGTGADGALAVGNGQTSYADGARAALTSSAVSGAVTLSVSSTAGFGAGDEALVIQMSGPTAGRYEARTISAVGGGTLTLGSGLAYDFAASGASVSQVVRVPNWTTVTVESGGTLTVNAWDGSSGGVMFFRATGAVHIQAGGELTVAGAGFTGGPSGAASTVNSNGSAGGALGNGAKLKGKCDPLGWCDSCQTPCAEVRAGHGSPAWGGIGNPVEASYQGRGCNYPKWCYGGWGGGGGIGGNAGAVANPGSSGSGPGAGAPGQGGANLGIEELMLVGGSGGGGHGGAQGVGGGGGGGGGGAVRRKVAPKGQQGRTGGSGGQGGSGGLGGAGGGILVVNADTITIDGVVSGVGANGAGAADGSAGEAGGAGGVGGVGSSNGYGNTSGAQGQGGRGAGGGAAGHGGGGGAGGTVSLRATQIILGQGAVSVAGGMGGAGGAGGTGGAGGAGPMTRGAGSNGAAGTSGAVGRSGRYLTRIIAE